MKKFFKPKSLIIVFLMYAIAISLSVAILELGGGLDNKIVLAGAGENVSGWAWSSNVGWVSFNSKECDTDGNGFIDSGNCGGDNATTPTYNYGVNIDKVSGVFSGHAWSPHVGWIHFAPTTGYPAAPLNGARLDKATGKVTGWAKILSMGDDGWIKMSDDSVAVWNGKGVKIDIAASQFSGYAWNANDNGAGIGWISFNCSNDSSCATADYKVIGAVNTAPTAINLTAPNWNYQQAGALYAQQAFLRWQFNDLDADSSQSAYRVVVDDTSDFSSPIVDTGKVAGSASQYMVDQSVLDYNISYYWRVMVWDDYDAVSSWVAYNTTPDTDNDDANIPTFTIYKHEMPDTDFIWFPAAPSKGEAIKFTDNSNVYLTINPAVAVDCDDAKCDWLWTADGAVISDATASTTTITFNSSGAQTVKLKVTDNDGYSYEVTKTINVSASLPLWRETRPR